MFRKKFNRGGGFTILETLIVLSVGALILSIVFIAVPYAQRESRNYQRKADINSLKAAMATYRTNHNYGWPTDKNHDFYEEVVKEVDWRIYGVSGAETPYTVADKAFETAYDYLPHIEPTSGDGRLNTINNIYNGIGDLSRYGHQIYYSKGWPLHWDKRPTRSLITIAYPGFNDLLVFTGFRCTADILDGGSPFWSKEINPGFWLSEQINASPPALIEHVVTRGEETKDYVIIYQLEGEDKARCTNDV